MREMGLVGKIIKFIMRARTTEEGSRTLVHAAQAGPQSHGEFLMDCKVSAPSKFVLSADGKKAEERVWKELSGKLEKIQPGVTGNI